MAEIEETLNRIKTHKGVLGIVVMNADGSPIRSTLDQKLSLKYGGLISKLTAQARSAVRELDPQNDLTFLRVRSKKHEIIIAPEKEYILVVVQNPTSSVA